MHSTITQPAIRSKNVRRANAKVSKPEGPDLRLALGLGLALLAGTLVLYTPVRNHSFITYDDNVYVVYNRHVTAGLNWQTIRWSLTSTDAANWHPVTWLSHALDYQLFGLDAGHHHLTSVVIHTLNVLLLFVLLQAATGAVGRSFLVAALFAWHPFNVQSVAWVAERKNLLSTFFFLLALGAYIWYARKPEFRRFAAVSVLFVLALASKPMAVTLPFVLMLLDYWPLQRVAGWTEISPRLLVPQQSIGKLLLEKLPLLALSAASSIVTLWAQRRGGAVESLQTFSLSLRLENAVHSYAVYIWKTFWPSGFAVYYPLDGLSFPLSKVALAITFLCAISFAAWKLRTTKPYFIMGWLWFVGTLLPAIGVVQVGDQAMADRYAYLPLIGLFIMFAWGSSDLLNTAIGLHNLGPAPRWALAAIALGAVSLVTYRELGYWSDSVSVWTRALQVTDGDPQVEKQFGSSLVVLGMSSEALPHLAKAASFDPSDVVTHVNLGMCYLGIRSIQAAIQEFETAVSLTNHPGVSRQDRQYRASALLNLGIAFTVSQNYRNALLSFQGANRDGPERIDNAIQSIEGSMATVSSPLESEYLKLSLLQRAKGNDAQAATVLEKAIQGNPGYAHARELLGYLNGISN